MEQKRYRPSQAAKILGVHPWTMRRLGEGKVPSVKSESARWYVLADWVNAQIGQSKELSPTNRCAIYARQSSPENKAALKSQVDGLTQYAQAKGYQIVRIVTEIASGLNDDRPKLHALLKQTDFNILLIEHKERLTRFRSRWFEALCPFHIEVVNLAENQTDDLMEDLVAIITSFAARLYGQRRGRRKAQAAIKALKETNGD